MSAMVTCANCYEDRSDETLVDDDGNVTPCLSCGSRDVAYTQEPTAHQPAVVPSRLVSLGDEECGRCGVPHTVWGVAS